MIGLWRPLGVAWCLTWALGASSAGADSIFAPTLAATCTTCHGPAGRSSGGIPALAGVPKARLVAAVMEMTEGRAKDSLMPALLRGYSPEEIDAALTWFAAQEAEAPLP
ncbi:MAG: hypothetical protein JNJ44_02395 [Zoogloeaceae bacterium]|nr:hypothetical protein [Zoogloeaceae bacterium]